MSEQKVYGHSAHRPRPTFLAALWLACLLAIPVGCLGLGLELIWRAF